MGGSTGDRLPRPNNNNTFAVTPKRKVVSLSLFAKLHVYDKG